MAHERCMARRVDTGLEQMGGIGMPEGMGSDVSFADTGALFGLAKSAWTLLRAWERWRWPGGFDRVRRRERARWDGGGFPGGSQQVEGAIGQGDVAVLGALTPCTWIMWREPSISPT